MQRFLETFFLNLVAIKFLESMNRTCSFQPKDPLHVVSSEKAKKGQSWMYSQSHLSSKNHQSGMGGGQLRDRKA